MLHVQDIAPRGLRAASFTVADGECVAVRGPSGSGKSMLLRAIADLDPCPGDVLLDGVSRRQMAAPQWRRQVCYVASEAGWWDDRVVAHFQDWETAASNLERLGLPREVRDWPVARLSTGERQRLALLRAFAIKPRVLLLDEPTTGLDPDARDAVETLVGERQSKGLAILWITHDCEQAARLASRRLVVCDGRITSA